MLLWLFVTRLCDELDNTTSLGDLALSVLGEVTGADDERDGWDATLAEDFAVAEWEEVEDWGSVGLAASESLLALLLWDERPELDIACQCTLTDRMSSNKRLLTLSRLMTGFQNPFCILWKYRIPTLPK